MNLFNKIRDLFTDEEEVIETREVEIEEREEHKLPTFMRKKIENEEIKKEEELPKVEKEEVVSDRELIKTNSKFSFPIAFDEKDFSNGNTLSKRNILNVEKEREKIKPVKELYEKKETEKPKRFKPTPIVSPVYGVLEKNYNKDDVFEKSETDYEIQRPSKKIDFETVRRKAFGTLTDDIKDNLLCDNCELLKEAKRVQKIDTDNLLSDIIDEHEDISIEEAEENYFDFGVEYEAPPKIEVNIDEVEINQEIKINDYNDKEAVGEKIEVKEELELIDLDDEDKSKSKEEVKLRSDVREKKSDSELDLTEDLYNLIDSMYEERDD